MKIPLHDTSYDFEKIRDHVIGAGILPVSVDEDGQVRLLLGKERYVSHWRGSLKWSGFEGGRKPNEEIEETASREFLEESIGSVEFSEDEKHYSILEYLKTSKYVARIVLCILHGSEPSEKRYHVTYVVQVPHSKDVVFNFSQRRRILMELQTKNLQILRLQEQIKEFDLDLPIEDDMWAAIVRVRSDAVFAVEVITHDDEIVVLFFPTAGQEVCEVFNRWLHMRNVITADCNTLQPICEIAVDQNRNTRQTVTSLKVNEDFVEKQCIQWWSYEELCDVIHNGGYSNTEFFRAYFLPVLQRSLDIIKCAKEQSPFANFRPSDANWRQTLFDDADS